MIRLEKNFEDFITKFGRIMLPKMNMSIYKGEFQCACSDKHSYPYDCIYEKDNPTNLKFEEPKLVAEGKMRVIFQCPKNPRYITAVRINQRFLKFKGFETISAYKIKDEDEYLSFTYLLSKLK